MLTTEATTIQSTGIKHATIDMFTRLIINAIDTLISNIIGIHTVTAATNGTIGIINIIIVVIIDRMATEQVN